MKTRLLLLGLAVALTGVARADYNIPVTITPGSFNADVVVEQTAGPVLKIVTDATLDTGTNNTADTWMEVGSDTNNPTFGFPHPNTTFTAISNANYSFKTAPSYVSSPNGILIDGNGAGFGFRGGTFTLTSPTAYSKLSFCGSGGNGGDVVGVTVHHLDGTTEGYRPSPGVTNSAYTFGCPDWFNGTSNVAWIANERMNSVSHTFDNVNSVNPRLYFRDITLTNTTSAVTSIDLAYVSGSSGSHNDVIGVSGSTGGPTFAAIDVTGYTFDMVIEASAAVRTRQISTNVVSGTNVFATTQTMDANDNTANTWYEVGYNQNLFSGSPNPKPTDNMTGTGLPVPSSNVTNGAGDHIYVMPSSYVSNNAVYLNVSNTSATVTLNTPASFTAMSLLGAAGGGGRPIILVIHHQDTTTETNLVNVPDWFDNSIPFVFGANGRVEANTGALDVRNDLNKDPRIFACDFALVNIVSPVTSIDLVTTNTGGRIVFFALSGSTGLIAPIITAQPGALRLYQGSSASFTSAAGGTQPIGYQWQKGTNGVYVNVTDGGTISGATTTTLTINPVGLLDTADYRMVASNVAGTNSSGAARLTVYSTLSDVTVPGDPASNFGGSPFGDGPVGNALDNNLGTKYGTSLSPAGGPSGLTVTPTAGATLISGLRIYTANDSTTRDPASVKVEGSINGGGTWTTILSSNALALPAGRNTTGGLDPLVSNVQEVDFANSGGYTSYRVTFLSYKGGTGQGSMQVGDVELLGVTTNIPVQVTVPAFVRQETGLLLSINATVTGVPTPDSRWQRKVGSVFIDLTNSGTVSGAQTPSLSINPVSFSDTGEFRIIASNVQAVVTSAVVPVTVLTTNDDVTAPGDAVVGFGDASGGFFGTPDPGATIDDTFVSYVNGGSGINAPAGFPPWQGPAGVVITPTVGYTVLTGIRVYAGEGNSTDDPANYILEGSNNGGATYALLSSGALSLPITRNPVASSVDPLTSASMLEILFPNTQSYSSYRFTVNNTRDNSEPATGGKALRIGELELLGVTAPAPPPSFTSVSLQSGNLIVNGSGGPSGGTYYVLSSTNVAVPLSNWTSIATNTFDNAGLFSFTNSTGGGPRLFFSIQVP